MASQRRVDSTGATIIAFSSGAVVLAVALGLAIDVVPAYAVTAIAALWILGTVLGIIDTFTTLREVRVERARALSAADEVLIDMADGNVRREYFRLLELLAILVVGLVALGGIGTNPVLGRLLILYVVILLISNARLDRIERSSTDALIRRARQPDKPNMENEAG